MNVFEMNAELRKTFDSETGEIYDLDRFKELSADKQGFIRNLACHIKNMIYDKKATEEEYTKLKKHANSLSNSIDFCKGLLDELLDGEKVKTPEFSIYYKNVEQGRTVIDDWSLVPQRFLKQPDENSFKKTEIAEAIKAGEKVPGAHLEDSHSIIIR